MLCPRLRGGSLIPPSWIKNGLLLMQGSGYWKGAEVDRREEGGKEGSPGSGGQRGISGCHFAVREAARFVFFIFRC